MADDTADRLAIGELLAAYCHAMDNLRFEAMGALFAEEGEWGPERLGRARGPAAIAELARSIVPGPGEGPLRRHLTTNVVVTPRGDAASVVSNFLVALESPDGPRIGLVGTYEDEVVRRGGRWLFLARRIRNDIAGDIGVKR